MRILIIGATRGIGLELLKQALTENHEVTVLARKPESISIKNDRLKVFKGDITDKTAVAKVVQNQDAVCLTIGIGVTFKPVSVFSEVAKNVTEAMQKESVKRLISVTGIGAGDSKGHGGFLYDQIFNPFFVKTIYADKDREEAVIKQSNLDWIIVRPGMLTNGAKTEKYRALTDLRNVHGGKISRADVAHFILQNLKSDEFLHQTPLLIY